MTPSANDLANPGLNEITILDKRTGARWPDGWKFPVYLPMSANDLIYDSQRGSFYASVPITGGIHGNNVVAFSPDTGSVTAAMFVRSEQYRMALSDDFEYLYVFNDGANSVVGIELNLFHAAAPFYTAGTSATGLNTTLNVIPGAPGSVLVGNKTEPLRSSTTVFRGARPQRIRCYGMERSFNVRKSARMVLGPRSGRSSPRTAKTE
jgi:hypothetical protein